MSNGAATSDKGRAIKPASAAPAPLHTAPAPVAPAVEHAGPGYGNAVAVRTMQGVPAVPEAAYPLGMSNAALARLATSPPTRTPAAARAARPGETPAAAEQVPAADTGAVAAGGSAPVTPKSKGPPPPGAKAAPGAAPAPAIEGKSAAPPEGGPAAPATAGAPAAKGPARPAVKLLMPEPPAALSRASEARIELVQQRAARAATSQAHLPSAAAQVTAARAAVAEPPEETQGKAGEKLVEALGERPAPSPEIEKFCEQITRDIREKRPRKVDDIPNVDPQQAAQAAGAHIRSSVQDDSRRVGAGYADLDKTPQGAPEQQPQPLERPPEPPAPELNAPTAVPDPVPPASVSLDADVAANRARFEQAGMDTPAARAVRSGPVAEARAAQGELEETAKRDPAQVLAEQKSALDKAGADMASLQQAALAALIGARKGAVSGVAGHQARMVGSEEQMRGQLSRRADAIFRGAQEKVQGLVARLQKEPLERWEAGLAVHSTAFKQRLQTVENWLKERYGGGWGKVVQFVEEEIIGLPDWVNQQYDQSEKEFGDNVCALLRSISSDVNAVVAACQQIIAQARQDIADVFTRDVPAALKPWAAAQLGVFNGQLDTLNTQVTEARDNFNKDLVKRADQAVQDVRAQVQALREKAQGILGRFLGAVDQFLADPGKAILDGLLELVGIPPAAFYEVVARIKTIVNEIARDPMKFANNLMLGIGQGFQSFFGNISTHLLQGLLDWLLSGMKGLGIELPKDFSLKSVVTFFLQLLGISWAKVRALLVKHIGAENVALIEKAWSVVSTLIEKGPEGLVDAVKQKLDPKMLLDQVLAAARNYLIEAVVKKVALRILALFNPAGAIAQAVEAIYRVLKWVFKNAARLFRLVETVVNGVYDILKGNVAGVAKAVESALAGLIAPVIDFLADYLGVGDLPDQIAEAIKGLQQLVEEALDWLIGWLVEQGKKLLEALGLGKDKKDGKKEGEIGEVIDFTAGQESHHIRIVIEGESAVILMASGNEKPASEHLDEYEVLAKGLADKTQMEGVIGKITVARDLLTQTTDAANQEVALTRGEAGAKPDETQAADERTRAREQQLADDIKELLTDIKKGTLGEGADTKPGDRIKQLDTEKEYTVVQVKINLEGRYAVKVKYRTATWLYWYSDYGEGEGGKRWVKTKDIDDYDYLRPRSPDESIDSYVKSRWPVCPIYGPLSGPVVADHLYALVKIINLPGFHELSIKDKLAVVNVRANFFGLGTLANSSKQDKSWKDWKGLPKPAPDIDPAVRQDMIAREDQGKNAVIQEINQRSAE